MDEIEQLRTTLSELQREKHLASYTTGYIAMGYEESLAADTALAFVDGDMDKVFTNQKQFLITHDKKLKKGWITSIIPKKSNGGAEPEFGKMSLTEIQNYYKEHPDKIPKN